MKKLKRIAVNDYYINKIFLSEKGVKYYIIN